MGVTEDSKGKGRSLKLFGCSSFLLRLKFGKSEKDYFMRVMEKGQIYSKFN